MRTNSYCFRLYRRVVPVELHIVFSKGGKDEF